MRSTALCALALVLGCVPEDGEQRPIFTGTSSDTGVQETGEEPAPTTDSGSTGGGQDDAVEGTEEGESSDDGTTGTMDGSESSDESSTGAEIEPPPCPEPQMIHFPVAAPHNIGYDNASCGTGTCEVSCPDINANSDWNGDAGHHGIDIFAHLGAPLVAVADGTVVAVGVVSDTSGLRVRIRDACGWEYYYGHLDEAMVEVGQELQAGEQLGTMGATGTASVHLHFNVSYDGNYSDDIDPFDLLDATSATAC